MKLYLSAAAAATLLLATGCEQNTYTTEAAPQSQAEPAPAAKDEPAVQIELKDENGSVKINAD